MTIYSWYVKMITLKGFSNRRNSVRGANFSKVLTRDDIDDGFSLNRKGKKRWVTITSDKSVDLDKKSEREGSMELINKKQLKRDIEEIPKVEFHSCDSTVSLVNFDEVMNVVDSFKGVPTVPYFVGDWIEHCERNGKSIQEAMDVNNPSMTERTKGWLNNNSLNAELLAKAWILFPNFNMEAVKFYAKIKGHELIDTDLEDEEDGLPAEFYRNIYFVVQQNGKLIIDMKHNGLSGSVVSMTMKEWNKIGVNDSNAEFEEVVAW